MKRFWILFSVFIISAVATVSLINFGDAGAKDEVAIQGSSGLFTSADLHPDLDGSKPVVYIVPQENNSSPKEKRDEISLKANTYNMDKPFSIEDLETVYDGSTMWVNVKLANVRSEATTESDIIDQVARGTSFVRISYSEEWSYIRLEDGTEGYILTSLISSDEVEPDPEVPEVNEETPSATPTPVPTTSTTTSTSTPTPTPTPTPVPVVVETTQAPSFSESAYSAIKYTSCDLNVRSGPDKSYDLVTVLSYGSQVEVVAVTDNGWYKISTGGYIKSDYCTDSAPVISAPTTSTDSSSGYSDFANYALQFVGTPYVYAGSSPSGFDCSGFVLYLYANYYGISLPHNADSISKMGTGVSGDGVQCGDVLCHDYNGDGYVDHVSIYIGNGTCIHASDSRKGVITSSYPMGSVVTIRRFV